MPGDFDPAYLTTLDEIYHSHWAMEKRRRIDQLKGRGRFILARRAPEQVNPRIRNEREGIGVLRARSGSPVRRAIRIMDWPACL